MLPFVTADGQPFCAPLSRLLRKRAGRAYLRKIDLLALRVLALARATTVVSGRLDLDLFRRWRLHPRKGYVKRVGLDERLAVLAYGLRLTLGLGLHWRKLCDVVGRVAGRGTGQSSVEPLLADEDLIDAGRMHGEGHQSQLARRHLRSNARGMRLVAMRIRISSQNHEVDRRLRAAELNDLVEIGTSTDILTTR